MTGELDVLRRDRDALLRELEAAGAKVIGSGMLCPFHEDHRPSAGVYRGRDDVWRFKCQACGVCEDIFGVRAKVQGRPLTIVLSEAHGQTTGRSQRRHHPLSRRPTVTGSGRVYRDLDALRAALPGRVTSQHAYRNPTTGQAIMIVFRCETPEGKSYRPAHAVAGGFALGAPAKPWPLYRREALVDSDSVVVCEGEKCCDALAAYGIVATTNPFGAGKANHCDWTPLAGKKVFLWPDNDDAGHNHMRQVQSLLESLEPRPRIAWIEPTALDLAEKEDAADLVAQLVASGKTQGAITAILLHCLDRARTLGPLTKLIDRHEQIFRGQYRCIAWPWPLLGTLTKALLPGTTTLFAGTVGASKSFMLLQAMRHWLEAGDNAVLYALEGDQPYHLARALAQVSGVGEVTDPDWVAENPHRTRELMRDHADVLEPIAQHLSTAEMLGAETLEQLAEWAEDQARRGRRIIAIDPITAAARTDKPWVSDLTFLRSVKRTATEHGCSIILVTHPQRGVTEPTRENLAGSAAYERFSETIITLANHDPKESKIKTALGTTTIEHNRTVRIEKARNGRGTGCRLAFSFCSDSLTLRSWD